MKAARERSPQRHGLSKSKITAFEQCARKLWLSKHRPELASVDDAAEARFATGHEVGALACSLFPTGMMIEAVACTRFRGHRVKLQPPAFRSPSG